VTYWPFNVEYGYKICLIFFTYMYSNKTHIPAIPSGYEYGYNFTIPDEYEYGYGY